MKTTTNKNFYLKVCAISLVLASLSMLAGCAGMHSDFDCNAVGGIQGCATLGQVNNMADQGEFNRSASKDAATLASASAFPTGAPDNNPSNTATPTRDGDTIQNVWLAPYTTKDGTYVWASMASIVIQPGHWVAPSSNLTNDGDL